MIRGLRGGSAARLVGASFLAVLLVACGASRPGGNVTVTPSVARDSMRALDAFVTGSVHELRGEYADAVLDFEEAYRADPAPAIAFVLAKDYCELHRGSRAATYADLAVAGEPRRTAYRMLRARIALELQGDIDEAERQFTAILTYDSTNVEALTQYATMMRLRGRHERAIGAYRRLFDMLGPEADVAERLAGEYAATGEYRAAIEVLQRGLRVDPGYVDLRDQLADLYLRAHLTDSATAVLEDLRARYPDDVGVRMQLARLYGARDEWPRAFAIYRTMCDDSLVDVDTLNVILDTLYARSADLTPMADSARDLVWDVADDDSTLWYANIVAGAICLRLGDEPVADQWFTRAVQYADDTIGVRVAGAQFLLDLNHPAKAIAITGGEDPVNEFRIHLLRAFAYSRLSQPERARAALYRSLALNDRNWIALGELGLVNELLKEYPRADSAYDAAIALNPNYASALNNYAYSLAVRNVRLDVASTYAARALALDPDNTSYVDTYGWVLFRKGEYDSAAVYVERAAAAPGASPEVWEHVGDVKAAQGRYLDAIAWWQKALDKDSTNDALREKIRVNEARR